MMTKKQTNKQSCKTLKINFFHSLVTVFFFNVLALDIAPIDRS